MRELAHRKVKDAEAQTYFRQVLCEDALRHNEKVGSAFLNEEGMLNTLQALYQGHGRGAELASAQGTAWGLLCAVTEYVDHERRARNTDNRLDSAWFGQGALIKQKALDKALQLVA